MTEMLTTQELQALVKKERGLDVEIVEANPICVTGVSLNPLGQIGSLFVFRTQDGALKAIAVPFGWGAGDWEYASRAA